jgi:hypothetical protein
MVALRQLRLRVSSSGEARAKQGVVQRGSVAVLCSTVL